MLFFLYSPHLNCPEPMLFRFFALHLKGGYFYSTFRVLQNFGESNWHLNLFWSPTCVVNIRVFTAPVCTITSVWFTLRLVQSATQIIIRTYLSDQDYTAVLWVQVQQHSWRHKSSPTLPAPPSIIQPKQHLPTYSFLGTDRHPKRRIISSLSFSGSLTISEREVRAVFVNH